MIKKASLPILLKYPVSQGYMNELAKKILTDADVLSLQHNEKEKITELDDGKLSSPPIAPCFHKPNGQNPDGGSSRPAPTA